MKSPRGIIWIAVLSLAACSDQEPEPQTEEGGHKALYNNVNAPLEKAKGVEQQLEENAEKRKAGRGSAVEPIGSGDREVRKRTLPGFSSQYVSPSGTGYMSSPKTHVNQQPFRFRKTLRSG